MQEIISCEVFLDLFIQIFFLKILLGELAQWVLQNSWKDRCYSFLNFSNIPLKSIALLSCKYSKETNKKCQFEKLDHLLMASSKYISGHICNRTDLMTVVQNITSPALLTPCRLRGSTINKSIPISFTELSQPQLCAFLWVNIKINHSSDPLIVTSIYIRPDSEKQNFVKSLSDILHQNILLILREFYCVTSTSIRSQIQKKNSTFTNALLLLAFSKQL